MKREEIEARGKGEEEERGGGGEGLVPPGELEVKCVHKI